jgi:hypothetical protein
LQVEALYVSNWAMPFFGVADGAISPLNVGKANVDSNGAFTIELPDFANDPTWPRLSGNAGFQFVLADAKTGKPVAMLASLSDHKRGGVVPVATSYPELEFGISRDSR